MTTSAEDREFGLGRGKVFPAERASSLVNPLRRLVQSPSRTVQAMGLTPHATVLEIGCGPGFFSPFIAAAVPDGCLVLVDLQAEMLTAARPRLVDHANVSYAQGDAAALPLRNSHVDAVLLATVLGEVPDPEACLDEVRRVLRPGGILTIVETRRDSDFIPLTTLRPLVEGLGLAYVDRRGTALQYAARFRAHGTSP